MPLNLLPWVLREFKLVRIC